MRLWRISNFIDLTGHGAMLISGRWHIRGTPAVYCADHPSTALLEILVQATRQTIPDFYQLIAIEIPDDIKAVDADVPEGWEADLAFTQQRGTSFLTGAEHALLSMPSVVMPQARNYLLNPKHPDAGRARIVEVYRYPFDSRLLGKATA